MLLIIGRILYIALIIFVVYRMIKGGGCCGGHHGSHGGGSHGGYSEDVNNDGTNNKINAFKDPICGMYVSEQNSVIRQINGQTYYFCSENCARQFEEGVRKH